MQVNSVERVENTKSLAMVRSRAVVGIEAVPVIVEVHLANGLPAFSTVGMPETAVKESKDRVRGAILNSGFEFPAKRITVNLAPADLPKSGGRFDLPIAIGILLASGQLPNARIDSMEWVGELALNGQLRKISGVLPTALACGEDNTELIVPSANASEASLAQETEIFHAAHLLEVCQHLVGQQRMPHCDVKQRLEIESKMMADLAEVKGQPQAKRALEVAASGGHSLIFVGPPGTGKSMLASRLPSIMPDLEQQEALETAAIQSVAFGEFDVGTWKQRPFRSPHHSSSSAALVGGGSIPKPGEISKAHNGILFLDELTEFSRAALEQLREPIESGQVNIARASMAVSYPANFTLVAACNPCPCGYVGDGTGRCQCSAGQIERYRGKLSGPLIDRIDLHVNLPRVDIKTLQNTQAQEEPSSVVQQRVEIARERQLQRQGKLNSELSVRELEQHCPLTQANLEFLELVCQRLHLSARAYHRILKLSRTIADMANEVDIAQMYVSEAVNYRMLDRN